MAMEQNAINSLGLWLYKHWKIITMDVSTKKPMTFSPEQSSEHEYLTLDVKQGTFLPDFFTNQLKEMLK